MLVCIKDMTFDILYDFFLDFVAVDRSFLTVEISFSVKNVELLSRIPSDSKT